MPRCFATIASVAASTEHSDPYGYGMPMAFCARNLLPCADQTAIMLLPDWREGISNVMRRRPPTLSRSRRAAFGVFWFSRARIRTKGDARDYFEEVRRKAVAAEPEL